MRGDEREFVFCVYLHIHFSKPAADAKPAAIEQKALIRMRLAGQEGESAQHRHVNVGVESSNMRPVRIIQSLRSEGGAQLQQCVGIADFLDSQHVRLHGPNHLAYLVFCGFALGMAGPGGFIEVVFQIVSGDGKSVRSPERRISGRKQTEHAAEQQRSRVPHAVRLSGSVLPSQNFHHQVRRKIFAKPAGIVTLQPCLETTNPTRRSAPRRARESTALNCTTSRASGTTANCALTRLEFGVCVSPSRSATRPARCKTPLPPSACMSICPRNSK